MRFVFTMNMASAKGSLIHQVFGDHTAENLEELLDVLSRQDFILVQQFYKDKVSSDGDVLWIAKGGIILNTHYVGKVQMHSAENAELSAIIRNATNLTIRR